MKKAIIINQEVRDEMAALRGGVAFRCVEATEKLVAKAEGQLVHYVGFHRWSTHNWAVDPVTGDVYDPTMEQFGYQWQPVIKAGTQMARLYLGTPQWEVEYWAPFAVSKADPFHVIRYRHFKGMLGGPTEEMGYNQTVEKVAKNGKPYLLIQREVRFTSLTRGPQLRSATIWRAKKGGHNAYVLMQKCVQTKNWEIKFPVERTAYYIPPFLNGLVPIKNGKFQEVIRPMLVKPVHQRKRGNSSVQRALAEVLYTAKSWTESAPKNQEFFCKDYPDCGCAGSCEPF